MVQNKQYPDVMEGDYFPDYASPACCMPPRT